MNPNLVALTLVELWRACGHIGLMPHQCTHIDLFPLHKKEDSRMTTQGLPFQASTMWVSKAVWSRDCNIECDEMFQEGKRGTFGSVYSFCLSESMETETNMHSGWEGGQLHIGTN